MAAEEATFTIGDRVEFRRADGEGSFEWMPATVTGVHARGLKLCDDNDRTWVAYRKNVRPAEEDQALETSGGDEEYVTPPSTAQTVAERLIIFASNEVEGDVFAPDPDEAPGWVVDVTEVESTTGRSVFYVDTFDLHRMRVHVNYVSAMPKVWHAFDADSGIGGLFQYRSAQQWARDLLDMAGFAPSEYEIGDEDMTPALRIRGTESVLRFMCVALNQHAEQAAFDPTPAHEAERLEETLSRPGRAPDIDGDDFAVALWVSMCLDIFGMGFHPDTAGTDYVYSNEKGTGYLPFFPDAEAELFEEQREAVFNRAEEEGLDIYALTNDLSAGLRNVPPRATSNQTNLHKELRGAIGHLNNLMVHHRNTIAVQLGDKAKEALTEADYTINCLADSLLPERIAEQG